MYRAGKNDGVPSTLDKLAFKVRRALAATMLHIEAARNEAVASSSIDLDTVDFKAAAQKAEAEFQVVELPVISRHLKNHLHRPNSQNGRLIPMICTKLN